jgi:hypothetical protein
LCIILNIIHFRIAHGLFFCCLYWHILKGINKKNLENVPSPKAYPHSWCRGSHCCV